MATMNINVKDRPPKTALPYVKSDDNTYCKQTMVITVVVPVGESRHVTVIHDGSGAISAFDANETITTTTDYTLEIDSYVNPNDPSQNTTYASAVIFVRLTSGGNVFYSKQISRTHTDAIC